MSQVTVRRLRTIRANVEELIGQYAQVRLVDKRSVNWGHNDFYDLK